MNITLQDNMVSIKSDNIFYSNIKNTGYGLQLNNEDNRDEVKKICTEISELIYKLDDKLELK